MSDDAYFENLSYAKTMMAVVHNLLVKGPSAEQAKAIAFSTRMDFNFYSDKAGDDATLGGYLHIACFAPSNYVHVLAAFTERPMSKASADKLDWQPIVCHDSAWREDGVKSLIKDTFRILRRIAAARFKKPEEAISYYGHLDELWTMDSPLETLKSGLDKPHRHGPFVIPGYEVASAAQQTASPAAHFDF